MMITERIVNLLLDQLISFDKDASICEVSSVLRKPSQSLIFLVHSFIQSADCAVLLA